MKNMIVKIPASLSSLAKASGKSECALIAVGLARLARGAAAPVIEIGGQSYRFIVSGEILEALPMAMRVLGTTSPDRAVATALWIGIQATRTPPEPVKIAKPQPRPMGKVVLADEPEPAPRYAELARGVLRISDHAAEYRHLVRCSCGREYEISHRTFLWLDDAPVCRECRKAVPQVSAVAA